MRTQKSLTTLLRSLASLLSEEAARNPEFAGRLDALLSPIPSSRASRKRRGVTMELEQVPDVFAEFASRGDADFQLWLRDQPIGMLRAVIRLHDFDATRRTAKWTDPEKLSTFIADRIRSRRARGSGFLTTKRPS